MSNNRITRVSGINIKGRYFTHELGALCVLVGENAAGKTAITDAITVAVLGYLPALGKKPGGTMALAPDAAREMEVEVRMMNGNGIRRTFKRNKTGGAGLDSVGTPPALHPAQMAFSEFLNAKPTERHQILNSLMGRIDCDALGDRIDGELARLGLASRPEFGKTINEQDDRPLEAYLAKIAELGRQLKQDIDQSRKTLGTLTTVEIPPAISQAELTAQETAVAEANRAVGSAETTCEQIDQAIQRAPDEPADPPVADDTFESAKLAVEQANTELATAKEAKRSATLQIQRKAAVERDVNRLSNIARDATGKRPTEQLEAIRKLRDELKSEKEKALGKMNEMATEVGKLQSRSEHAAEQIAKLESNGTCPCCGTTGKSLEAAMAAMETGLTAQRNDLSAAETSFAEMKRQQEERTAEIARFESIERQIVAWQAKDELQRFEEELERLKEETTDIDVAAFEQKLATAQRALRELTAVRDDWQAFRSAKVPTADLQEKAQEDLKKARQAAEQANLRLTDLRAARARHDQATADQQRISELTERAEENEALLGKAKELLEFLKQQERDAAAEAMRPLFAVANVLTDGLLRGGTLAIREHLLGIERGDQFLQLETLSGMEMIAVAAACQAALATKGELPIIIVDELARMTPNNRARFAENCARAIEQGVISQAILIDQALDHHTARVTAITVD